MTRDVRPTTGMPPRPPKGTRWGGRQKGTPNKVTQSLRDAVQIAFDRVGGVDYLVRLAEEDPKIFVPLLAKTMPSEPKAQSEGLTVIIERVTEWN